MVRNIYKIFVFVLFMKMYGSYILLVIVGFFMAFLVVLKLLGGFDVDSDWFWFLAGIGLAVEGVISLRRQAVFDKKYKITKR